MSLTRPDRAGAGADAPTRSEDTVQFAHDLLRDDILTGGLHPGAVLSQVQLAGRLGISRTPLREALRRLIAEGLVTGDFNRRMRVSELDLADFDQIYAMRFALEPIGIRATIPVLSNSERTQLTDAVERMDTAVAAGDREAFRLAHRAFHLGLTSRTGSRMSAMLAELWDHSERYRLRYLHQDGPDGDGTSAARLRLSQTEHRAILQAALSCDVEACTAQLVNHLQRTLAAVFQEAAPPPVPRLVNMVVAEGERS